MDQAGLSGFAVGGDAVLLKGVVPTSTSIPRGTTVQVHVFYRVRWPEQPQGRRRYEKALHPNHQSGIMFLQQRVRVNQLD